MTSDSARAVGSGRAVDRLNAFGKLLGGKIYREVGPARRPLAGLQGCVASSSLAAIRNIDEKGHVSVCVARGTEEVTKLIFSIYVYESRVPEAEEVLLCSGQTTPATAQHRMTA